MTFSQLDLNGTYSYADYLKWTFDEKLELIKGKVFNMSPAPARIHQDISGNIFNSIKNYLKGKTCKIYDAPFDVRLTATNKNNQIYTVVQPYICVICDLDKLDDRGCVGAPDLIVEILSPGNSKKVMKDKFEVYQENGVKEYWIVQPLDRIVLVYILNEKGIYIGLKPFTEDDTLTCTVLNGLEIPVTDVFEY